jgi:hypothetical protein
MFCCNMSIFACPIKVKVTVGYLSSGQIPVFGVFALKYPYLASYIRFCPRIQLPVSAQWSQRLYVQVQRNMMHKDMHKIIFQSN